MISPAMCTNGEAPVEHASGEKAHRVLIVEDKLDTAEKLNLGIGKHPSLTVVGLAYDLAAGLSLLSKLQPRVVLVDLGLPDGSGIRLIESVQRTNWPCDAIVISVFGDEERVLAAIRAGAKGYVLKNDLKDAISTRILEVVDGGSPISPKIARMLLGHIPQTGQAKANPRLLNLTPRETQILDLLSKGFRRQEIAKQFGISVGTVGVHVSKIYEKLDVRSNVEAINIVQSAK